MSDELVCRCGHSYRRHRGRVGPCDTFTDGHVEDPFVFRATDWETCPCRAFDDSRLPEPGERLTFGVHRQPSASAETAEAWPSLPSWSARVKARTTRALRSIR